MERLELKAARKAIESTITGARELGLETCANQASKHLTPELAIELLRSLSKLGDFDEKTEVVSDSVQATHDKFCSADTGCPSRRENECQIWKKLARPLIIEALTNRKKLFGR